MAITITHAPDMASLAMAGYYAGAGEDMRWREEMAARERSQLRQMQMSAMQQQLQQHHALQRMGYGAQLDEQQQMQRFGQQAVMQQDDQRFRRELADMETEDRIERMQLEHKNRLMMQRLQGQSAAEADQNEFMYRVSDDKMSQINDMLSSGYEFSPEEQQRYQSLIQEIERAMNDETLRPHQKAQAAMKAAHQLPIPSRRRPTPDDVFDQMVTTREVRLPSGKVVVERWAMDRNGTMHLEQTYDPDEGTEQGKSQDAYLKAYKDAAAILKSKTAGGAIVAPSHEEIDALALKMLQSAQAWSAGGNRESPASAPSRQNPQRQPTSPTTPVQLDAVYDPKTKTFRTVEPSKIESLGLGAM